MSAARPSIIHVSHAPVASATVLLLYIDAVSLHHHADHSVSHTLQVDTDIWQYGIFLTASLPNQKSLVFTHTTCIGHPLFGAIPVELHQDLWREITRFRSYHAALIA